MYLEDQIWEVHGNTEFTTSYHELKLKLPSLWLNLLLYVHHVLLILLLSSWLYVWPIWKRFVELIIFAFFWNLIIH